MCENPAMRIGVSLRSTYRAEPRVGARWMVERARTASEAGLDSLFVGDHHVAGPSAYYQNVPILGRLLAEWCDNPAGPARERKSGALFLLPLWNPVLAAEQIGTLASLADGRFVMQTAIGGGAEQFAGIGEPLRGRAARFEQGLDVVRRLLAGETVSARVGDLEVVDARIAPLAPEPLEVWIGGSAEAAIARAARLGDGWLANANHTPGEVREQAAFYLERCAALGHTPTAVAIRRDVHVGADTGDAARVAEPIVTAGHRGFPPEACTYGSVEEVAERIRELGAMGFTDIIVRQLADEQADALASIERLGEVRARVADA
jgi:alkanesulfonate monooxygenase SsuD/methylene tetrahydromethanopterin reductase-like flavin-dependent oxidoreductase (luciferase family)